MNADLVLFIPQQLQPSNWSESQGWALAIGHSPCPILYTYVRRCSVSNIVQYTTYVHSTHIPTWCAEVALHVMYMLTCEGTLCTRQCFVLLQLAQGRGSVCVHCLKMKQRQTRAAFSIYCSISHTANWYTTAPTTAAIFRMLAVTPCSISSAP